MQVNGVLAANGASGGDFIFGGSAGTTSNAPAPGNSDSGNTANSPSGSGSAGAQIDGSPGSAARGSGGGGAGRIRINGRCPLKVGSNVLITPARTTPCHSEGQLGAR